MNASPAPRPLIDIEALLAPIAGGDPAGEDIRYGVEHDQIKEARREDADLPQGVWKSDRKRADWGEVIRLAKEVLTARSKDAQVAAWLCEALLGRHGLGGMASGLSLLSALVAGFGPALHPRADEDGDRSRLALVFEWLNNRLVVMALTLPVTNPPGDRETGLTFGDFLNSQRLQALGPAPSDMRAAKTKAGPAAVTLQLFNATVRGTGTPFYRDLYLSLRMATAALENARAALDLELDGQAPSMSELMQRLGEMTQWTQTVLRERGEDPAMIDEDQEATAIEEAPAPDEGDAEETVPAGRLSAAGPIASRRDAYRQLAEIAEFLARTEPHSPTPYILHRIVQWRDLPLPVLLGELSRGRKDVAAIFELVGTPGEEG